MKILGIDTTGQTASAALVEGDKLIAEFTMNYKLTHSQTILPMIADILERTETDKASIDCIACALRPRLLYGAENRRGNGEGLCACAGQSHCCRSPLDALAYNVFETNKFICPIMDARRNQVYAAFYMWENGKLIRLTDHMAESIERVIEIAEMLEREVIFSGGRRSGAQRKDWNRTPHFYSLLRTAICKEHLRWQRWAQSWQRKDWQSRAMHLS